MKIIDEALLSKVRARTHCEVCLVWTAPIQPHHIMSRGMGGAGRMDITENLVAVCPNCHRLIHDGHIHRDLLVKIVAAREKTTPEAVWEKLWELRRRRK